MNYLCEECQGSGYIMDKDGHLDICEKCWGLGYVVATESKKPEISAADRQIRKNSLLITLIIMGSVWGIIFFLSRYITYNIYEYFLMLFGPYYLGMLGSLLYVRHKNKQRRNEGDKTNLHGH